jgi:hypothetical protein
MGTNRKIRLPLPTSPPTPVGGGAAGGVGARCTLSLHFATRRIRYGLLASPPVRPPYRPKTREMNLLGWLRKPDRDPARYVTRAEYDELLGAVHELDRVQVARELEWQNLRDQLKRQLGRLAAYKQREDAKNAAEGEEERGGPASLRELLHAKYPKLSNGGE